MKRRWNHFLLLAPYLIVLPTMRVAAQSPGQTPHRLPALAQPLPMPPPPLPALPTLRSPVALFRDLLALPIARRPEALTNRPPQIQKRLLAKLHEYEILPPDERELRLLATELRWYLEPLMSEPVTNRAARLALVPAELRALVEERMHRWDLMPPPLQQTLLDENTAARDYGQMATASEEQKKILLSRLPADQRARLEAGMQHWQNLSQAQREEALSGFNAFFELTPREKTKTLNSFSVAERDQMEQTLQAYGQLSPPERTQCLRSFEKLARLTPAERQSFLKNAMRWQSLSPAERQAWRDLVRLAPLPPPLPAAQLPPHLPPRPSRHLTPLATNGN